MNWAHLPEAGGLYDQKPQLLDRFLFIFQQQAEEDKRKEAIEKSKQRHNMGKTRRR